MQLNINHANEAQLESDLLPIASRHTSSILRLETSATADIEARLRIGARRILNAMASKPSGYEGVRIVSFPPELYEYVTERILCMLSHEYVITLKVGKDYPSNNTFWFSYRRLGKH